MKIADKLKENLRKWLYITDADPEIVDIKESISVVNNQIKNKIWLRGQASEIEQLFKSLKDFDQTSFWGNVSRVEKVRKIHTGLPSLIVNTLTNIVVSDLNGIDLEDETYKELWEKIDQESNFSATIQDFLIDVLATGDGAFKVNFEEGNNLPLIEFYEAEKVQYLYKNKKLKEIIFRTDIVENDKEYMLMEKYGTGYIEYELFDKYKNKLDLTDLQQTKNLKNIVFLDQYKDFMMAVKFQIWKSNMFKDRGKSLFDGKDQAFDVLDEIISQMVDALRKARTKVYIPENLIPKDKNGVNMLKSDFINQFIQTKSPAILTEGSYEKIDVIQPDFKYDGFVGAYSIALDMCLQGIISPSTLGIDIKKLDNGEAQREKEKMTLYTRNAIIAALTDTIINIVQCALNSYNLIQNKGKEDINVNVTFGEYASPSFEAILEVVNKGAGGKQVLSYEKIVQELWGNSLNDEEKEKEIERLKELNSTSKEIDYNLTDLTNQEKDEEETEEIKINEETDKKENEVS